MSNETVYRIAIIGSGPGGMSAAGRAAERGISHILLEGTENFSNTIHRYQKGKFVMDTPQLLPLRSSFEFAASSRENVLGTWESKLKELNTNIQYNAYVEKVEGSKGEFILHIKGGEQIRAERVVLGIGLQGNIRKLGVDGEDLPFVMYQLDDPEEYEDETIVIVGAGDAAIENAVALAKQNRVIIVNRKSEFSRAKEGNLNAITKAIDKEIIECYYNATVAKVEANSEDKKPGVLTLNTDEGVANIEVNRIIARLGALPPRGLVESFGVGFPSKDPASVPVISETYESNVAGLYIVGALGGNELIKAAMNQGYEVVEHIEGTPVKPADEPLLEDKFKDLDSSLSVSEILDQIKVSLPFLSSLSKLQFREFILDSEVHLPNLGEIIYKQNDFSNTFYSVVTGRVQLIPDINKPKQMTSLQQGIFFGEWSLISGRRRSDTAIAGDNCVLIGSKRRMMRKVISSDAAVKQEIDRLFIIRAVQSYLAPGVAQPLLANYLENARIERFKPGELLQKEDEPCTAFHLIRMGSVTLSHNISGRDTVISYLPAGEFFGEMAILSKNPSTVSASATVATETIRLDVDVFTRLMNEVPQVSRIIEATLQMRLKDHVRLQNHPDSGEVISFMMREGLGEATDVLVIDESLCVHCDNCEKACAETHNGTSRLDREAGPSFATVHIPTSCRHCEQPHCMKDCPPDAIHRAENGEVYIDSTCIGCSNCQQNCPYGVIQMASLAEHKSDLLDWLLFGTGSAPGEQIKIAITADSLSKKAVKCDMCKDLPGGQACVRACPTGAAIRVNPEELVELISK